MTHLSEESRALRVNCITVDSQSALTGFVQGFSDACMLVLPPHSKPGQYRSALRDVGTIVAGVAERLGPDATLIVLGEVIDLVQVQAAMSGAVRYQHWIAIKRKVPRVTDKRSLPSHHFGALVQTRYSQSLRHTKTRVKYTYCPFCNKTTKDYGGKKHTYHEYGTLLSDVWRDLECDLEGDLTPIIERFRDLFGIDSYSELLVLDCRTADFERVQVTDITAAKADASEKLLEGTESEMPAHQINEVLHGDCLEWLSQIPDNSVDFVSVDPPYNLRKKYAGYTDDLEIREYFSWCDRWIAELARVLKPGRTLALLNIPLWAIRHFLFMDSILTFQNWIVWDALAFPVRLIMPSHYTILAFSKGESRELPGLVGNAEPVAVRTAPASFRALEPLADGYCHRFKCVANRQSDQTDDRGPLTDLWWDIHRLKHNTRRVDHPTQLPPHLLYRLIAVFTKGGEIVLDCFNGAGTTTLAAHQMGREYVGIEKAKKYRDMAKSRHEEILKGLDPFRRAERQLTAKNSPVPRLRKQKYEIPKKTLQLEVRRVAHELGHLPNREELARSGRFSIKYYDEYFISWGEVCAAARTTGMSEDPPPSQSDGDPSPLVNQMTLGLDTE